MSRRASKKTAHHIELVDLKSLRRVTAQNENDEEGGGDEGGGRLHKPDFRESLADFNKQEALLVEQTKGHGEIAPVIPHKPKSETPQIGDYPLDQANVHPLLADLQYLDGASLEDANLSKLIQDNPEAAANLQEELKKQHQKRLQLGSSLAEQIKPTLNR